MTNEVNENVETLDKKILEAQESLAELQKRREKIPELQVADYDTIMEIIKISKRL